MHVIISKSFSVRAISNDPTVSMFAAMIGTPVHSILSWETEGATDVDHRSARERRTLGSNQHILEIELWVCVDPHPTAVIPPDGASV